MYFLYTTQTKKKYMFVDSDIYVDHSRPINNKNKNVHIFRSWEMIITEDTGFQSLKWRLGCFVQLMVQNLKLFKINLNY